MTLFFCAGYFPLQRLALFPVRRFEPGPLDLMIEFDPRWVWAYQSAYLLMAIVPWLADSRDALVRYARGVVILSCAGFVCFLLWPVAGPRPPLPAGSAMYRLLVSYDAPTNAFPSLHVALTAYTVLFAAALSRSRLPWRPRAALLAAAAAWGAAIAYATLATRQHYAVDVFAGALLAWICHRWTWLRASVHQRRIDDAEAAADRVALRWDRGSPRRSRAGMGPARSLAASDRHGGRS